MYKDMENEIERERFLVILSFASRKSSMIQASNLSKVI